MDPETINNTLHFSPFQKFNPFTNKKDLDELEQQVKQIMNQDRGMTMHVKIILNYALKTLKDSSLYLAQKTHHKF